MQKFLSYTATSRGAQVAWETEFSTVAPNIFSLTAEVCSLTYKNVGYAEAQLVEALRYKREGRGFDFRRGV